MSNPHENTTLTVEVLARRLGRTFRGRGETPVSGFAALETAGEGDLVFLEKTKHRPALDASGAAAALIPAGLVYDRIPVILSDNPRMDFFRAVPFFSPPRRPAPGIHATARVAPSARLAEDVSIGAGCVIGEEAEIGPGCVLHPLVSIYPRARIGRDCVLHSHVSIREEVRIGDRVVLHNGAVVGADGFGYLPDENKHRVKIPQTGTVVIEDDVEVGANSTVDRATLGETVIGRGVKIDNLVQVGHNVRVGEHAVLMAQVGVAGSSVIGARSLLCGQAGVADHVTVGRDAVIAAQAGVISSIPDGAVVAGTPHLDIREWRKSWAAIPRLQGLIKEIRRLNKRVEELEKSE